MEPFKRGESWCLFTFCPRKGPIRGNPKKGIHVCDPHWKEIHEGIVEALNTILPYVHTQIENYMGDYDAQYVEEFETPIREAGKFLADFRDSLNTE